jgi:hypothetical protein
LAALYYTKAASSIWRCHSWLNRLCRERRVEQIADGPDMICDAKRDGRRSPQRRATDRQILEDADHLITVWNERQAKRMPMLFSPTIGAAITVGQAPLDLFILPGKRLA